MATAQQPASAKSPFLKQGRGIACALFALGLAAFSALPARAEPTVTEQEIGAYRAADESHRVHILIQLCQAGFVNAAEKMLGMFPLQGPMAQNRTLYVQGMIAERRGKLHEAAADFRTALASDPHLTLVRAELAQVLARMDETDSAKHHLELLAAETQDQQQLAGIRSFMQSLDARRPFTFSGYMSLAPSTNFNQGSTQTTVWSPGLAGVNGVSGLGTISSGSQAQSGIGLLGGFDIGYSRKTGDHTEAVFAGGVNATYYPAINSVSLSANQSIELRGLMDSGYVGIGAVASENGDIIQRTVPYDAFGPRISIAHTFGARDQLTGSATYEWRNYSQAPAQNGNAFTLSAIFTHALDSTANVAGLFGYENVTQQIDYNSYQDATLGLGFYKEFGSGITLQGQGTGRFAQFNAMNPVTQSVRQDEQLTGSLSITKRDWYLMGLAPSLSYTYVRNFSNISLYDFDSHSFDLRLTKNF